MHLAPFLDQLSALGWDGPFQSKMLSARATLTHHPTHFFADVAVLPIHIHYYYKLSLFVKGLTLVQALRSRVGAKGCWRHFFKNPTTQLHVVWGLTEKKCEQTPKFACFSVQRRPLHMSQAEMLPSHAVLKEGIK